MRPHRLAAFVLLLLSLIAASVSLAQSPEPGTTVVEPGAPATPPQAVNGPPALTETPVAWRRSRAVGKPNAGRLVRGVELPAAGRDYFTWDSALKVSPSRPWRRWGTDRLVRTVLEVLEDYRAAHPDAARVGIGDLSRPQGGSFDESFGGLGHASHQNGRDVDIYYPRLDGTERRPYKPGQVDRALAQDLVDRFAAAGAEFVFVGTRVGLRGPGGRVQAIPHHDDHLHVRIRR